MFLKGKKLLKKIFIALIKGIPLTVLKSVMADPAFLKKLLPNSFFIANDGFCPCCDSEVQFISYHPWLRDYFICSNCKSIPRERALMLVIEKYFPNWKSLRIHESSPGKRGTSLKLKNQCLGYLSSQYFPNKEPGEIINGSVNIDLEMQTFNDESFDLVVTQDVMEHIYNPSKAFSEIARTLKKGGAHIFTVPIVNKFKLSERWANKAEDGSPIFLKTAEFHGNPVDPKGSPVAMHWGYDIVDFIKKESGLDSTIEYLNDLRFGVRAEYIEVIISKKI